jgi:hypothetical protein
LKVAKILVGKEKSNIIQYFDIVTVFENNCEYVVVAMEYANAKVYFSFNLFITYIYIYFVEFIILFKI